MADLAVMVALPGHAVLIRLDATDRRSDPDWSARVTNAIAGHDADRVGKLTADYETAVADQDHSPITPSGGRPARAQVRRRRAEITRPRTWSAEEVR